MTELNTLADENMSNNTGDGDENSHSIDDTILAASLKECTVDDTSTELAAFEKQYAELKRKHEEEVSYFSSKLRSLDTPAIFGEYYDHSQIQQRSSCDAHDFSTEENMCLNLCSMLKNSADGIMQVFEKRNEEERESHFSLQSLLGRFEEERQSINKDIKELRAANNEQVYNLKKGITNQNAHFESAKVLSFRSTLNNAPFQVSARSQNKLLFSKTNPKQQSDEYILKKENMELENQKATLAKTMHEHVQRKNEYQRNTRQIKEEMRRESDNHRVQIRSLELRDLDARQKSAHLEEANSKLDDVCKTLASTIEATKQQLDAFQQNIHEIQWEHVDERSRASVDEISLM